MLALTTSDDERIVDIVDDGGRSPRRALAAAAASGLLATALVATCSGSAADVAPFAPAVVAATAAAAIDVRTGRIPDRWVAATAMAGLAAAALSAGGDGARAWASGGAVALVPILLLHLTGPGAMGFGDVKYAAALGGLLGMVGDDIEQRALAVSVALMIASALAVVSATLVRRLALAFGPWLLVGCVVTICGSRTLGGGIAP